MKRVSGLFFLPLVLILYAFAFAIDPTKTRTALHSALHLFVEIIPILVVVVVLMGFLGYLFDAKRISRHIGEESGLRGWIYAIFGGILSHGPSYIWYPMLADLRTHGAKESLIVTFFYTRAIKIPWLPVMIGYFEWRFTLLFCFWLIVSGIVQGLLYERLFTPSDPSIRPAS